MFPVEEFHDSLRRVTSVLNRLSVRFHLTGGAALVAYSEPRMTQDINIVLDPNQLLPQIDRFAIEIGCERFMFEEPAIRTAVKNRKRIQLLDLDRILKLDFYPRELIPGELDRTVQLPVFAGGLFPVVALRDLISSKLVWISRGSGKSRTDLRWLWRLSSEPDREEIRRYAQQHQIELLLDEVLLESDEIAE